MIKEILELGIQKGASDVILSADNYISYKINGDIVFLEEKGKLSAEEIGKEIMYIIPDNLKKEFENNYEVDFALQSSELGRFRVNAFKQKNGLGIVFRIIKSEVPEFDGLNLPDSLLQFTKKKNGLMLVTGSVGSGKSTTLAALLNEINKNYKKHIITIEDPIEFIHPSKQSLIEQREVGVHTQSFDNGLKYALRQASDVIMVGEMRDLETFRLALRAAETGNLVFATLHTSGAARTVSRIIDMFPGDEKDQIRTQLAESLLGVVWQDLVKTKDGKRVAAMEIMINNTSVSNMIRENHVHQINSAIETGRSEGMISMEKYLELLLEEGIISEETYKSYDLGKKAL